MVLVMATATTRMRGAIKKLTVTGSYFHQAKVGRLLKSRAAENHIIYNRFTDEVGGRASNELEFPNGGPAYVVGNTIADDRPKGGKLLVGKPGDWLVRAVNNLIAGSGSLNVGEVELSNNIQVDWDVFVQASRQDFRLLNPLKPIGKPVEPGTAGGVDLRPRREYLRPRQTRAL